MVNIQITYSALPSLINSHLTFAPILADTIFLERGLNSISKSNLNSYIEMLTVIKIPKRSEECGRSLQKNG